MDKLTDQEKSVVLARAMGWQVVNIQAESGAWLRVLGDAAGKDLGFRPPIGAGVRYKEMELKPFMVPDLYDPQNMALAWRVLNWAASQGITTQIHVIYQYKKGDWARMIDLAPADAQRAWLDYILRKAIEAGMVENGH